MAEIANGTDDGPPVEGGLLRLGENPDTWSEWESDYWRSPEPFDGTAARVPGIAFPLSKEWQWEYDYSDDTLHSSLLHETYLHGSVLLGKGRPGAFWTLVVAGPQRGQVWSLRDGCAAPYADAQPDQQAGDFLTWATDWHTGRGWWQAE
ncbi:hypothetical protein ACFZAM_03980 [Streptomyces sp. NPDC008079]|uniref:hypothetical protein n=1 Tax=Streptomyces sp. NPDC008079 TaxID=3364806 RepID=UPI0036F00B0F